MLPGKTTPKFFHINLKTLYLRNALSNILLILKYVPLNEFSDKPKMWHLSEYSNGFWSDNTVTAKLFEYCIQSIMNLWMVSCSFAKWPEMKNGQFVIVSTMQWNMEEFCEPCVVDDPQAWNTGPTACHLNI